MNRILPALMMFLLSSSLAFAAKPTWARKAIAFPSQCDPSSRGAYENEAPRTALAPTTAPCKPTRIPSPDGKSSVEVRYLKDGEIMSAYLLVTTPTRGTRKTTLPDGFQDIDLLWSPDSTKFFVNGGNGGGYWGFWMYVYVVDDPDLKPIDVTRQAQRDMVVAFPPCKAAYMDRKTCKADEANPEYNMSGIDWLPDSSAVVVMAEVPCAGSYGGIMCQVMGYELGVPTGRILKRMTARQFAATWQKSMAWKFRAPDPPEYCEQASDPTLPPCAGHDW